MYRAEVGGGGGHDEDIVAGKLAEHGLVELGGRLDIDALGLGRSREGDGAEDCGDAVVPGQGGGDEGEAELAAGAVGDEPDGVNRFASWAGGDQVTHRKDEG